MSDSASAPPDKVCPKCGLRIGQVGSFTYWIFNDDRCRCNAAESNDAKGQVFDRRYQLVECVGQGAMGYVYKAIDSQTQGTVALKLLRRELAGNELAIKRLMKEVAIMSGLNNTNLGHVIGYGQEQEGVPYLVMEYVEGQDLSLLLQRHGTLKLEYALDLFVQICSGLSCAHANGIVHRDLKPSNIIVQPAQDKHSRDRVVIVDFGFAKLLTEVGDARKLTQEGEAFGTPAYMSPEQCRGERLDERSDIYSFGCIMYEALTGMPPLLGPNVLATVAKQVNEAPLSMQSVEPGIPEELDAIVLKCLEKDPIHRYQSASDLRQELDQYAKVGSVTGRRRKPTKSATAAPAIADKTSDKKSLRNAEAAYLRMIAMPLGVVVLVSVLIGCAVAYNVVMIANKNAISAEHADSVVPASNVIQEAPVMEQAPQPEEAPPPPVVHAVQKVVVTPPPKKQPAPKPKATHAADWDAISKSRQFR